MLQKRNCFHLENNVQENTTDVQKQQMHKETIELSV